MFRVIKRDYYQNKWTGYYRYYVISSSDTILAPDLIKYGLTFQQAYYTYSTVKDCIDQSGDMEYYRDTGKVRVAAWSEKW
jgi:hypothetical protein